MDKIVNNIRINDKNYEIGSIIDSFIRYTTGSRVNMYYTTLGIGDKGFSKLCYESSFAFDENFDEIHGLCFSINKINPSYITYSGIMERNSGGMFINDSSSIMRIPLVEKMQNYVPISIDSNKVLLEYRSLLSGKIDNVNEFIGKLIMNNSMIYFTDNGMKISISPNCIISGLYSRCNKDFTTKADFFNSISSEILCSRNKSKDLNWFMYKIYMLNSLFK